MKDEMTVHIVYYDLAQSDVDIVNTVVGAVFSCRSLFPLLIPIVTISGSSSPFLALDTPSPQESHARLRFQSTDKATSRQRPGQVTFSYSHIFLCAHTCLSPVHYFIPLYISAGHTSVIA